jgi:putative transposase
MGTFPLRSLILTVAGWVNRPQEEVIGEYVKHYHLERNHQGLGNELIEPPGETGHGRVACRQRLGGVLRYYHRWAA